MGLNPFARREDSHMLVVSMTGVRRGDRIVQVGCPHDGRLAAVAGRVGLSGRAVAVVPDDASASRASKGAARAGVLVEIEIAPPTRLPIDDASFDLAVVDDTDDLVGTMGPDGRVALVHDLRRVLRPGGRVVVIGTSSPAGVRALFSRARPLFVATGEAKAALEADEFTSVRTLCERDGLVFVEGIKPRNVAARSPVDADDSCHDQSTPH